MKFFSSLTFKFAVMVMAVLIIVFSMQAGVQIRQELSSDKERITKEALSFSSLSAKPLVDNYKLYYDSGFYKFKEVSERIIALDGDLERIQIITVGGELLFDSEDMQSGKKIVNNRPDLFLDEIVSKKIAGLEPFSREINLDGKVYLEVIQPYVEDWGRHQYSVLYLFSFDSAILKLKNVILMSALVGLAFFSISVVIIFLFSKTIVTRPLNKLMNAINDYAKGSVDVEKQIASIKSSDEIGRLAFAFSSMMSELSKSKRLIEQRASDLEKTVIDRTKKLQSNVDELEKMSELTVGRELKMVELKKRIGELERQLKTEDKNRVEKREKKQEKK